MRVMIVCAHSDDEVLGAGGAIARHVAAGDTVRVVIAADCRSARGGTEPAMLPAALDAAKVLGIEEIRFLGRRGMSLDAAPELPLVQAIEAELRDFQAATIYTHCAHDLNGDHRAVSRAVMVATRPFGAWQPEGEAQRQGDNKRVLHFEVPSSTGYETPSTFAPNYFVALDEAALGKKIAAMKCYAEEMRPAPHPRSHEGLGARAMYWGQQCGAVYAEPFMIMREVVR